MFKNKIFCILIMCYNIDILLLKNAGLSLNEIIEILPYEHGIIENIYNNDTMEIINN